MFRASALPLSLHEPLLANEPPSEDVVIEIKAENPVPLDSLPDDILDAIAMAMTTLTPHAGYSSLVSLSSVSSEQIGC